MRVINNTHQGQHIGKIFFPFALILLALHLSMANAIAATNPAIQSLRFSYDQNGNIATRTDATGATTHYGYDPLDRLISVEYPDRTRVEYQYDGVGRVVQMTDPHGTTKYEYDVRDRLTSFTDTNNHRLQYRYGDNGLLSELIYPEGTSVEYAYDEKERLKNVRIPSGTAEYEYDEKGRVSERVLPNGVRTRYKYDGRSRLVAISHYGPDKKMILGFQHTFDGRGNLVKTIRREKRVSEETSYSYDTHNRIAEVVMPGGKVMSFEYDARGNRTLMRSSESGEIRYHYDKRDYLMTMESQEGTTHFQYDSNGNLIERENPSGNVIKYSWDFEDRLIKVIPGDQKTVELFYDGNGLLIGKTVDGKATQYINNINATVPVIVGQCTSPCIPCFWGSEPFGYRDKSGEDHFFLDGRLGSISALTGVDGNLLDSYNYDSFGKPLNNIPPMNYAMSPLPYDPDIGLSGGSFDPGIGRSIQDPVNIIGKTYSTLSDVATWGGRVDDILEGRFYPEGWKRVGDYWQGQGQDELFGPLEFLPKDGLGHLKSFKRFMDRHRIGARLERLNNAFDQIDAAVSGFNAGWKASNELSKGNYATASVQLARPFAKFGMNKAIDYGAKGLATAALAASGPAWAVIATAALAYKTGDALKDAAEITMDIAEINARNVDMNRQTEKLRQTGLQNLRNRNASRAEKEDYLRRTGVRDDEMDRYLDDDEDDDLGDILDDSMDLPPCYPFCDDGGGPPGSVAVGGVSLDQVAEVMADLRDIQGAAFDPESGQLVLAGRDDTDLPEMDLDDLVVTIRTLFSGQEPSMSIEPCEPGAEDGCMKVHYNGRFQLPDLQELGWAEYHTDGNIYPADPPTTYGTRFGHIIFEADRYLKTASLSKNNMNTNEPFETQVAGFIPLLKRYENRAVKDPNYDTPSDERCMIRTRADRNRPSSCSRMWFVPDEIVIGLSLDGKTMEFDPVRILIDARFVRFDDNGQMVDVPGEDPEVTEFVNHFNEYYMTFAEEKWELMSLVQLAKIVGLIRWIRDYNIPLDLSWIDHYEVSPHDTPITTPGVTVYSDFINDRKVGIYGGVEFLQTNTYKTLAGKTDTLAGAALKSRPSRDSLSWKFEYQGEQIRAAAMHLAPSPIRGTLALERTDASLKEYSGFPCDFTLRYSSANPGHGPYGKGWSFDLPQIKTTQEFIPGTNRYYTTAVLTQGGDRTLFKYTTDGAFRPQDPESDYEAMGLTSKDPFKPRASTQYELMPSQPGKPIQLMSEDARKVIYDGFAIIRKDGTILAFDTYGRLIGIKALSGKELRYEYGEDDGRLTRITGPLGDEILMEYDADGQLSRLRPSQGPSINYTYDSEGHLVRVVDENERQIAAYGYDPNGRLSEILDDDDRILREMGYDNLNRVISLRHGTEKSRDITYDYEKQIISYTDPNGKTVTRRFDEQGQLVAEASPETSQKETVIKEVKSPKGDVTEFHYDESGTLTSIVSPLDDRMRFITEKQPDGSQRLKVADSLNRLTSYDYDPQGRITKISTGYRLKEISNEVTDSSVPVDPEEVLYTYNPSGNLATVEYRHYTVSRKGNLSLVESQKETYEYDDRGNLDIMKHPDGSSSEFIYDKQDRLVKVRSSDETKLKQKFNKDLSVQSTVTSMGNRVEYTYDDRGRITNTRTAAGTTDYDYANGKLASVTNTTGGSTRFNYDNLGRLSTITFAEAHELKLSYDDQNRLTEFSKVIGE